MAHKTIALALGLGCLLALGACSPAPDDTAADDAAASDAQGARVAGDAADGPRADDAPALAAGDIAAIEARLAAENAALARVDQEIAKGVDDVRFTALALSALQDATRAGAAAAGMDEGRYGRLKQDLFAILGAAEMRSMLRRQRDEADTTGLDEATVAQMARDAQALIDSVPDPFVGMDAGLAGAVREAEARLMALRAQNVALLVRISERR